MSELRRRRVAGILLVATLICFVPFVALAASDPTTAALWSAAEERGYRYVNGSLPLEVYAGIMQDAFGARAVVSIIVSLAVWALYAVAVFRTAGLRRPQSGLARAAKTLAVLSPAPWALMMAFDLVLAAGGAESLPAYYALWLGAEGALTAIAGSALACAALSARDATPAGLPITVSALAGLAAAGSLVLIAQGGMPPIIAPLLAAVLGVGILIRARSHRFAAAPAV